MVVFKYWALLLALASLLVVTVSLIIFLLKKHLKDQD